MKRIKTTLMASVLACATFNAQAEVSPLSYGIKAFGGSSAAMRCNEEVKIGGKKADRDLVNLAFGGGFYLEYACTDYIGFSIQPGYLREKACLTAEKDSQQGNTSSAPASKSIGMQSHSINVPLYLCIYPMGREEEGILKVILGGSATFPLKTTYQKGEEDLKLTSNQEDESAPYDLAVAAGVEYEFPFGLSLQGKYSFGLMNRFKTATEGADQTIFDSTGTLPVTGLKKMNMDHLALGIGYNFASLFSE